MKTKIVMIALLVVAAAVAMTVYAGGIKTSDKTSEKCSNCASCGSCSDEAAACCKK